MKDRPGPGIQIIHSASTSGVATHQREAPRHFRPARSWDVPDEAIRDLVCRLAGEAADRSGVSSPSKAGHREHSRVRFEDEVGDADNAEAPSTIEVAESIACFQTEVPASPTGSSKSAKSRPRPASAGASSSRKDELISVLVDHFETSRRIALRVHPSIRVGPELPPKKEENRFLDVFGSDKGDSNAGDVSCTVGSVDLTLTSDLFRSLTSSRGDKADQAISLKSLLEDATGIQPAKQRLAFKNSRMSCDEMTIRSYGIGHGCVVQLRSVRGGEMQSPTRGATYACSAKQRESKIFRDGFDRRRWALTDEKLRSPPQTHNMRSSPAHILSRSSSSPLSMSRVTAEGSARQMPMWTHNDNPRFFAPVGIAFDGHGGGLQRALAFGEYNIYKHDVADPDMWCVRERIVRNERPTTR